MQKLPKKVLETLEKLRKSSEQYLEIKVISDNFYLYSSTSEWDKDSKKIIKKTHYRGTIKPDGTFVERKAAGISESTREVFEYGSCKLAHTFLSDVESYLKERHAFADELIAMAIVRAIDPQPLRLVSSAWEKYYLSKTSSVSLDPKHLSKVLHMVGTNITTFYDLFSHLSKEKDVLFYDLSSIITRSEELGLAEKGYNAARCREEQVGVVMAFSHPQGLPIGIDVFFGSQKDIATISDFKERYRKREVSAVVDRGFASLKLAKELKKEKIHYVMPLKKNWKIVDYSIERNETFIYRKRPILFGKKETKQGHLFLFEDPKLRGEQEATLLKKVAKKKMTMKKFDEKRISSGIIAVLTDLDVDAEELFRMYKSREDIELCFDTLKTHLEMDKTYLRENEKVRGYYIVALLSARIYFHVLKRLREKELVSKISVAEVFLELSKWNKIIEKGGREYFATVPKRARGIIDLFNDKLMG